MQHLEHTVMCVTLVDAMHGGQADGKTVFTSDEALDLAFVPEYVAIVGSGYIGLEFSDVYTALGAEVTFIEVRYAVLLLHRRRLVVFLIEVCALLCCAAPPLQACGHLCRGLLAAPFLRLASP